MLGELLEEERYDAWLSPSAALAILRPHLEHSIAIPAIVKRLQIGLIAAAAGHVVYEGAEEETTFSFEIIPPERWEVGASNVRPVDHFWRTGDLQIQWEIPGFSHGSRRQSVSYFDVRFDTRDISALIPHDPYVAPEPLNEPRSPAQELGSVFDKAIGIPPRRNQGDSFDGGNVAAPPTAAASPQLVDLDTLPNKGGRPRAEFWDDLVIETIRRIYEGELKPKNQADVVRAMQDWLSENGYTGGLTQIKPVAAKIFKKFQ